MRARRARQDRPEVARKRLIDYVQGHAPNSRPAGAENSRVASLTGSRPFICTGDPLPGDQILKFLPGVSPFSILRDLHLPIMYMKTDWLFPPIPVTAIHETNWRSISAFVDRN